MKNAPLKVFFLVMALVLVLPCAKADELNPQEIGYLEAEIEFTSYIGSSSKIDELNHSVYLIPESFSNLKVSGSGDMTYSVGRDKSGNRKLDIFWKDFRPQTYRVSMKVTNQARFNGPGKTVFPYSPPPETLDYLAESDYIVISDEVREKALEITRGSENGFEAITRISTWIYSSLEYDLSYSGRMLPSDEVYKIRKGTCDEFTNLFLAMCRAAGIPGRYVAGIIYSKEGWGYHAWAEVYLGKWIPVDPTWNEIGWLDATHIEFGKFTDGGDVKVTASYLSDEKETVQITQPEPSVTMTETMPVSKVFSTELETYPDSIGIGESSVLTIRTTTSASGCLATSLKINPRVDSLKRPIVSVTGDQTIFICPGETRETHFVVTSNASLDERYTYYSLADIYTFLGDQKTIDLEIDPRRDDYSKLYLKLDAQTVEAGESIGFLVISDGDYRIFSNLPVTGNRLLTEKQGSYYVIAATETGQTVKKDIEVWDRVTFRIKDIRKPSLVRCGEKFNVSFVIENLDENYFEIETRQSGELRYVPVQYVRTDESEKTVTLESILQKNCTGGSQFLSITVNEQIIYEKIETEKTTGLLEKITGFFRSLFNRILLLLD